MNFSDENLLRFLDRELSDEESALVAKQVANDPVLAHRLAHFRATSAMVRDATTQLAGVDLPASWASFESRLAAATPTKPKTPARTRTILGGVFALAAAALIALYVRNQSANSAIATVNPVENHETVGESDELAPSVLPTSSETASVASRVDVLELDPGEEKSRIFETRDDGMTTTIIWMSDHAPN